MIREMVDSEIEWIGDIPNDWSVLSFKYIMQKKKEICKKYNGENILSLTKKGVIIRDLNNPTGKMPGSFDGYQKLKKGNILLCLFDIDVTPRCVGIIKYEGLTSPAYSQFELKESNSLRYYNYLLTFLDDKKVLLHLTKSLRNTLTENDFGQMKTIQPPFETQQKVANFLDNKVSQIDSIIEKTKQSIEELKKYKQSLITETVTKGLYSDIEMKESGVNWIGSIPKHWGLSYFKYEIYIRARLGWKGLKAQEYVDKGIAFLSTPNIKGEYIEFNNVNYITRERYEESPEIKLSKSDVLLTKDGSTLGTVNVVRSLNEEATVNSSIAVLTPSDNLDAIYLYYLIMSDYIQNDIRLKKDGMGVPHLFQKDIRQFRLILPPLDEQRQISIYLDDKVQSINRIISNKDKLIFELENYKKSLIYEYVTGKKEVI
ncbi:restriction endonuclease subunit S [Virgibacillus salexigens]|uniref:restriction endonuclease subunit S n=1 Tax=Virgibacillus salexigens TaxID=61016 RepID=UPI00190D585E|nr:restriction endonuclease subunit S [Virgibacillus salexigens]